MTGKAERKPFWDVVCTPHLEVIEEDKVLGWWGDWCVVCYPAEGSCMEQFCVMKHHKPAGTPYVDGELMGVLHYAYEDLPRQDDPQGIHRGSAVRFAVYQARRNHRIQLNQMYGRTEGRVGPVKFRAGQSLQLPPRGKFQAGCRWFIKEVRDGSDHDFTLVQLRNGYTQEAFLLWSIKRQMYCLTNNWGLTGPLFTPQEVQQALCQRS